MTRSPFALTAVAIIDGAFAFFGLFLLLVTITNIVQRQSSFVTVVQAFAPPPRDRDGSFDITTSIISMVPLSNSNNGCERNSTASPLLRSFTVNDVALLEKVAAEVEILSVKQKIQTAQDCGGKLLQEIKKKQEECASHVRKLSNLKSFYDNMCNGNVSNIHGVAR